MRRWTWQYMVVLAIVWVTVISIDAYNKITAPPAWIEAYATEWSDLDATINERETGELYFHIREM
jgi:hypothetical protein